MKAIWLFSILVRLTFHVEGQEPLETGDRLELLAERGENLQEDDSYLQRLESLRKHPINLNSATAESLTELQILNAVQIGQFLRYRRLLGELIHIYELQSVPGMDLHTITRILPYITLSDMQTAPDAVKKSWRGGQHTLLIRYGSSLHQPEDGGKFVGSNNKVFARYKYNNKGIFEFGISADKDAGEELFKGSQKRGFDFYSFHFFLRKTGFLRSVALGDYSVNAGQGLVLWQGVSFSKSASVMDVKRQSPVLRPYASAGESNFMRGVGAAFAFKHVEGVVFASSHKVSANLDTDSVVQYITSFLTSGNHRTADELNERKNVRQSVAGITLHRSAGNARWGANIVGYLFSKSIKKQEKPYNLFALEGDKFLNISFDYSYTIKNYHFFGEWAVDKHLKGGTVNGILISFHRQIDATFLYRHISTRYQSPGGNAFTEGTYPVNESGFYCGLSIRPVQKLSINLYSDHFHFPWLKYLTDAPSYGREYLAEIRYRPDKKSEVYLRYKTKTKYENADDDSSVMNYTSAATVQNLRIHFNVLLSSSFTFQNRYELSWWKKDGRSETGFLMLADLDFKPPFKSYSSGVRVQAFETTGNNSRIYVYEYGLPFSISVPQFAGKGLRYVVHVNYRMRPKHSSTDKYAILYGVQWSQHHRFSGGTLPSITPDQEAPVVSELKCQIIFRKN